ncbi:hypothetical protein [Halalkalibacter krulwichiae]|uniref:Uncharacterized protein n=1 Tax=Halalkalibacter krulwichiae TaxID=199441 RepID=A0A1X9MFP6_9BACI|nr:hypothetical protein [Halalkalibacter krulwichiae]ARK31464.1 hypothetical protein BkAM31D_17350 [Halalkalibacter krulwichiae]
MKRKTLQRKKKRGWLKNLLKKNAGKWRLKPKRNPMPQSKRTTA